MLEKILAYCLFGLNISSLIMFIIASQGPFQPWLLFSGILLQPPEYFKINVT